MEFCFPKWPIQTTGNSGIYWLIRIQDGQNQETLKISILRRSGVVFRSFPVKKEPFSRWNCHPVGCQIQTVSICHSSLVALGFPPERDKQMLLQTGFFPTRISQQFPYFFSTKYFKNSRRICPKQEKRRKNLSCLNHPWICASIQTGLRVGMEKFRFQARNEPNKNNLWSFYSTSHLDLPLHGDFWIRI